MTAETPSFFVDSQFALMRSVLDRIVPASEDLPGAGELGVAAYIDRVVGPSAELKRLFARGLIEIDIGGQAQHSEGFVALSNAEKDGVLRQVESREPAFFQELVRHTYYGYYSDPRIVEILGLEARPPQPRGHVLEQGNLDLIENVKRRGQVYRDT